MASKTSLPIARLRSLGCKVHTIVGHYPQVGDFKYGVVLPVKPDTELFRATHQRGHAAANFLDDGRLYVRALTYRSGEVPPKSACEAAEADVAGLLNSIADALSKAGR